MKKTFLKYSQVNSYKKFFYYFILLITISLFSQTFYSCGGSEEEPNPEIQRAKDSVNIYKTLGKVFSEYQNGLIYNETQLDSKTKKKFETSLKTLNKIDDELLESPRNFLWKKDFVELGTSIVQDYLITQSDIQKKSLVFKFAKRLSVDFEEVEKYTETDIEPLPQGSDLPLVKNSAVEEYITFFSETDRGRNFIDKTLYRSGKFFPLMRKILRYHGAPEELIYLSVQESGLNPTIVSRAGATGLWQFMTATGNSYDLYQDGYRDDRRDFEKSTDAAARHLKDLYKSFDDWYLAFAAYNAGPGRVLSAIRKSGSNDFWEIRNYLPGETKNYVPSILALSFIFRNPEEYNFTNIEYANPIAYDRIDIKGELSFEKIAEFTEVDIETIRELNPELMSDEIPAYDVPYRLRIPHGKFNTFVNNYKKDSEFEKNGMQTPMFAGDELHDYKEVTGVMYRVNGYYPDDLQHIGSSSGKKKVIHTFKKGEFLNSVALSYSVRPTDIRIWNKISYGTYPKENQELEIYISEEKYKMLYGLGDEESSENSDDFTSNEKTESTSQDEEINEKETVTEESNLVEEENNEINDSEEYVNKETESTSEYEEPDYTEIKKETSSKKTNANKQTYIVKDGDYLSKIAIGYGVSVDNIKNWNSLKNDIIYVNQKLTVYSNKTYTSSTKNTTKKKTVHKVSEGEHLTMIAEKYGVKVSDLKKWNNLEGDAIYVGQSLAVSGPKNTNKKKTVHKVSEGEHLTMIAEKYGVKVSDLKKWNNLEGDAIYVGQSLAVSGPKNTNKKKTTSKKTNYKVQEGNTLSAIAGKFGVTVNQLKKWNNLESDIIFAGQTLKIYSDGKTSVKNNKTTKTKTKKKTNKTKQKDVKKKKVRRRKT